MTVAAGRPAVAFVVPALNEAAYIGDVIAAIRAYAGPLADLDITVVDNGSTDDTPTIASRAGARVVELRGATVAAMRNAGAACSAAPVLVFVDGDVMLTPAWAARFPTALERLARQPLTVTGSRCGLGRAPGWLERAWFEPVLGETPNYINSGHLVTTRALFERIGGFDAARITGEDSDFARRARAVGAEIVNDPALAVLHEGYPKTLAAFFRRERWHGTGNFTPWSGVLHQRVAQTTLAFLAAHVLVLGGALWHPLALAGGAAIGAICGGSALRRSRRSVREVAVNSALYYVYFAARSAAFGDALGRTFGAGGAGRGAR